MTLNHSHSVFVTGADGFLGSHLVRELLKQGYAVTALIQPGSPSRTLEGLDITRVEGDLFSPESFTPALEKCSMVVHTAASTAVWPARSAATWKINVEATQKLIEIAKSCQIERFIHVGTANSFGNGTKEKPGNEETPYNSGYLKMDYHDSKKAIQNIILQEARENGFPAIIVNPTYMLGPMDSKPGSNLMILTAIQGKLPGYSPGGRNFVHVRDVAIAIVNALTQGRIGECYIAGHENLSLKEFFMLVAVKAGMKPPKIEFPKFMVLLVGRLNSFISWMTRKPAKLSYKMAKSGCINNYYSANKAITELSMPQTPVSNAVEEAIEWFRINNYV